MFYTIYKITNKINGKYYIGKHQTTNLNDGYMGSGKILIHAIKKYGIENFTKEILLTYDNEAEMNAAEKELVVIGEETYNLCEGGKGGFSYINKNKLYGFSDKEVAKKGRKTTDKILEEKYGPNFRAEISGWKEGRKKGSAAYQKKYNDDPKFKELVKQNLLAASEKAKQPDIIEKKKLKFAEIGHQKGEKNSQFGKFWITNGQENKMIKPLDSIPDGWYKGRTI